MLWPSLLGPALIFPFKERMNFSILSVSSLVLVMVSEMGSCLLSLSREEVSERGTEEGGVALCWGSGRSKRLCSKARMFLINDKVQGVRRILGNTDLETVSCSPVLRGARHGAPLNAA